MWSASNVDKQFAYATQDSSQSSTVVNVTVSTQGTSNLKPALDKPIYHSGDSVVLKLKGATSGDDFTIPISITLQNRVITISELHNVEDMQVANDEYKRRMNSYETMTSYDSLKDYFTREQYVTIPSVTLDTNIVVNYKKVSPVYRLYNIITSEHLFTTNKTEYDNYVNLGQNNSEWWVGEGIAWISAAESSASTTTVYRLYNAALGAMGQTSHYYTTNVEEVENLVANYGWTKDSDTTYFLSSGDAPIYTCYNESLGSAHHYTASKTEWESLKAHGWDLEEAKNGTNGAFRADLSTSCSISNTYYTVRHNLQTIDVTGYTTYAKTVVGGNVGESTSAKSNTYSGFTQVGDIEQKIISLDNTTVVDVFYDRNLYKIDYNTNFETAISSKSVCFEGLILEPEALERENYTFGGWFYDSSLTKSVAFGQDKIGDSNITLYAKWTQNSQPTPSPEPSPGPADPEKIAIDKANITVDLADKIYNGSQITPSVSVKDLSAGTDFEITYGANTNAGIGTITVAGIGNYTGTFTYEFTINPQNISGAQVGIGNSLVYNGQLQTQSVSTVTVAGRALASSDYNVSNNQATNAGNYTLTVTGKGNYTGSATAPFVISKASVTPTESEKPGISVRTTVNKKLSDVSSSMPKTYGGVSGTFAFTKDASGNAVAGETSVGSEVKVAIFYSTFTPADITNYNIVENVAVNVTIKSEETVATNINIGDYIELGTYDNQKILWRCVAVDENGPLMLADKVIVDYMAYDATTSDNSKSASHSRNYKRATYGSNHWRDSNMRSWLNSDATAGNVKWLCGNAPKAANITNDTYAYDQKAGFLSGFSANEAAAIKTTTQRSIVSHPEYAAGYIDAPGSDLPYNTDINSVADGFSNAYYENITDKVFLLDVQQLSTVNKNLPGYHIAKNKNNMAWNYWLRTPVTDCNHDMRYVGTSGTIGRDAPYNGYYGVRPAFYLDVEYYQIASGTGTSASPYVGDAAGKPADTTELTGAEKDTGGNWDVDTEQNLQLHLGANYSSDGTYANPVIPVVTIQKPGNDNDNMVIVICADGYTKSQMSMFVEDVKRIWQGVIQKEPYKSMKDKFNVYALCTASEGSFGSGNTFFDVQGTYSSAYIGNINGPWKNHILERAIGPAFIEKFHDAHIKETTNPNEIDMWGEYDGNKPFHYVNDYISQFIVLGNTGSYFGGSNTNLKSGLHYIVAPAHYTDSTYIVTHELGHGLFWLGDEYTYSYTAVDQSQDSTWLNASYTGDPNLVKWKDMLGFRNTFSCPHYDNSYIWNPSHMCIMEDYSNSQFCDVCLLQANKRMSQLIKDAPALYVAEPEVKKVTGTYDKLDDFKDANASGWWKYTNDRSSRLLSGSSKSKFTTDMKGQEVELRTIVQNLSDTNVKNVKLRLWVQHSDGTKATTTSGAEVSYEQTFEIPLWSEKSKFYPKGMLEYPGSSFASGLKNCSLKYKIPEDADLKSGDTIGFEVIDTSTNKVLASDATVS